MGDIHVRPDVRAFLDMLAATPRPPFTADFIAMIRTLPADTMGALDLPVGDLAVMRDLRMPGPGGDIALRLFDSRAERGPGPMILFLHGGGFCLGSIDTHAGMAAEIARQLDLPLLSVEYRLAPEHPWPAAPDDTEAAARWIARAGAVPGREITGLILCGDSAGGNLAIVTALALRDMPAAVPVVAQIAFYPGVDQNGGYESRTAFADGYGLTSEDMALYAEHYRGDPTHRRFAPLLADQAGMPPTLVATASLDPLRDEGRAYAGRLAAAGVPTIFVEADGMVHGYASYRRAIPSAQADLSRALTLARVLIGRAEA